MSTSFFEYLFVDRELRYVDLTTFESEVITITGTPRIESGPEQEHPSSTPTSRSSYFPIHVYDDDKYLGTYKIGTKVYKEKTYTVTGFTPS
jgi:hypothetical protein